MILEKEFFQAPNAVFDNPDLGLNRYDRMVYLYLCRCSNQGADAFPGYGGIARKCGISRATARRAVKRLEDKDFIKVTRRPISNGDNESNLYQVNQLPSRTRTTRVVSHRHQPSVTGIPPLVKQGNQSSTQVIPYKEPFNNNQGINNQSIKDTRTIIEDTKGTTLIEDYHSRESQATNGLAPFTDKRTFIKGSNKGGANPRHGTTQLAIIAYLREHGEGTPRAIAEATGIRAQGIRDCLSQNKALFTNKSKGLYALKDGSHDGESMVTSSGDTLKEEWIVGDDTTTRKDKVDVYLKANGPSQPVAIARAIGITTEKMYKFFTRHRATYEHPEYGLWYLKNDNLNSGNTTEGVLISPDTSKNNQDTISIERRLL
ncbi:helix-turn-helix domain-containing protein [Chloroflexota bacterium]